MERIFQISAAILAGIAAYFLWTGYSDGAFVAGVLGAVSFFLSIRFQVKERNRQRELEEEIKREQLSEGYWNEVEIGTEGERETIENRL